MPGRLEVRAPVLADGDGRGVRRCDRPAVPAGFGGGTPLGLAGGHHRLAVPAVPAARAVPLAVAEAAAPAGQAARFSAAPGSAARSAAVFPASTGSFRELDEFHVGSKTARVSANFRLRDSSRIRSSRMGGGGSTRENHAHDSRSVLGESCNATPMVVPTRGFLDDIKRLMLGDIYIGRGSKQRSLLKGKFSNPYKVSQHGRSQAVFRFEQHFRQTKELEADIWTLSGTRLVCHCRESQECHGDVLVREFKRQFPGAYDRAAVSAVPPSSAVLNYLARLREEASSSEGSSADEGAAPKGSGWRGNGPPMVIGTGYTSRELCDGQTLASPGRWEPSLRTYPQNETWKEVSGILMDYARRKGTPELLARLALGKVDKCPFNAREVQELRDSIIDALESREIHLERMSEDRTNVPVDFRLVQALLAAAEDPEVALGSFAAGVRVGRGARLPRLPALYPPKRK